MTTYLYREASSAAEPNSWDADRLMRWCAQDLYLGDQPIRWYSRPVKARPGQLWRDVAGPGRIAVKAEHWAGWVDWDEPGIAVMVGQSKTEMLKTVAHEMYHRYEDKEGRRILDETRAETYARRVTTDYIARRIP